MIFWCVKNMAISKLKKVKNSPPKTEDSPQRKVQSLILKR